MDLLTLYGVFAVTSMLLCYALEERCPWWILGFAVACALGSIYDFLQSAWPFDVVEAEGAVVALRRWYCATSKDSMGAPISETPASAPPPDSSAPPHPPAFAEAPPPSPGRKSMPLSRQPGAK